MAGEIQFKLGFIDTDNNGTVGEGDIVVKEEAGGASQQLIVGKDDEAINGLLGLKKLGNFFERPVNAQNFSDFLKIREEFLSVVGSSDDLSALDNGVMLFLTAAKEADVSVDHQKICDEGKDVFRRDVQVWLTAAKAAADKGDFVEMEKALHEIHNDELSFRYINLFIFADVDSSVPDVESVAEQIEFSGYCAALKNELAASGCEDSVRCEWLEKHAEYAAGKDCNGNEVARPSLDDIRKLMFKRLKGNYLEDMKRTGREEIFR